MKLPTTWVIGKIISGLVNELNSTKGKGRNGLLLTGTMAYRDKAGRSNGGHLRHELPQ